MARLTASVLLTLVAASEAVAQAVPEPRPFRVLALWADDRLLYAVQQVDGGLRSALASEPGVRVEYFGEFMDVVRFGEPTDLERYRDFLQAKYRRRPPDVIVAGGRPALDFLLDHRATLFPGVPIVHAGLTDRTVPWARLDDMVAGLTGASDSAGAIDFALRLQPDTRQVGVIGGVSRRDRELMFTVEAAAAQLQDRLAFTWLTRHTMEELKTAVRALPPQSVVIFVSLFEDASGRLRFNRDALEELAPLSRAPIYGNFESYVGYGVVGGTMETWQDTGEEAGRLAIRILRGQAPGDAVAGRRLPVRTIVDWRQVERWGLERANFPPGTEFRFRQPSLWEAYRAQVLVVLAIGAAQLALIVSLVVALRRRRLAEARRREAEARAAELRDELAHGTRVTLLGELAATLAHEINQPLAAILSNAQATKRWLNGDRPNLDEVRATVDDIIADDKRAGEIIHRMRALLKKGDRTRTRFDMAKAIRDVAALLHGELVAANVTLGLELPPDPLLVDGDEVATEQVLLNLMMNGIQSIQDAGGRVRRLQVEAARVEGTARVTVHDTGGGVSEELRATLFQPFITTKPRGLGVGLAICRRIAEAHGGSLDLGVSPTGGATFVLSLPSAEAAA
jgi:signal transduction histidine kinase